MKPVVFHPEAEQEMLGAAEFYERIVVVAVMHLHREPGYWKSRL